MAAGSVEGPAYAGEAATPSARRPAETGSADARTEVRRQLLAKLSRAQTEDESKIYARQLWEYWFEPPSPEAAALMARALELRRRRDRSGALAVLDRLVETEPQWAEGWNQRATMRFEVGEFDASLDDIEQVLALEPSHFGALSGQAMILMHQGRVDTARSVLRRAIAVHPFLAERRLLLPVDGNDQRT